MMRIAVLMVTLFALLAGCGERDGGELTAEENRQLDEAERMLEEDVIDVSPDDLGANAAEIDAMLAEENEAANLAEQR